MKSKIFKFLKENWLIILIIIIGAFLRLYKIDQFMTFLGDEGRDAIIVRRLLVNFDPILIGPGTSIGGMYLGPLYYYLIAPALLFANFSPAGPSVLVALIGVATIYFIYFVANKFFSKDAAIISALLYAVSPVVIIYSRSSWNPNVMPFFALLCIYSIWKVWNDKKFTWLVPLGISYAFVLQSHYLGLLLLPTILLFWILTIRDLVKNKLWQKVKKDFVQKNIIALTLFLLLMSPLAIFDLRHNYINSQALYKFFTVRQETVSIRPWTSLAKIYPIFKDINTSLIASRNIQIGVVAGILLLVLIAVSFILRKKYVNRNYILILSWISFGLIGLGLYKQNIYEHYYGFLFPAIFILFSYLLVKTNKYVAYVVALFLVGIALFDSPAFKSPNMQMQRSQAVAEKIGNEAGDMRFNLAVIAERNYEDGYQYFLEKNGKNVVDIDSQVPDTITEELFVVCEMPVEKCDPTHSAKAEVANFGWSKIKNTWEVMGVTIYELVHSKE